LLEEFHTNERQVPKIEKSFWQELAVSPEQKPSIYADEQRSSPMQQWSVLSASDAASFKRVGGTPG
jgi:hypothetical protein